MVKFPYVATLIATTVATLTGVSTASAATSQSASTPPLTQIMIMTRISEYRSCVNAPGGDGGVVLQISCPGGWGNERWNLASVSGQPSNVFRIVNVATNRCLEIAGWSPVDAAAAMTWMCHTGTNQMWEVNQNGPNHHEIKNINSRKCLDIRDANNWVNVTQWTCHGGWQQQFLLTTN